MQDEIIRPRRGKNEPSIGPVAVMVAMEKDLALVRRFMGIQARASYRILTSKLYMATHTDPDIALVGPMLGAPYAVMILEKLIVLGAQNILFFGWCGSIRQSVCIGDFVVPDRAVIGEGTSAHYCIDNQYPRAYDSMVKAIEECCEARSITFLKGPVWSTDAPYRETRDKVLSLQGDGVLGVDMELSALFTVSSFRHVELGALLLVSDELTSLEWKSGFSTNKFNNSRKVAAEVISTICQRLTLALAKEN